LLEKIIAIYFSGTSSTSAVTISSEAGTYSGTTIIMMI